MRVCKDTVCEDTLRIITDYYHLNPKPLFDVLANDCVWLSIGNLLVYGASAIKAQFKNGFIMPAFELEAPDFRLIHTGSDEQLTVLGEYTLYPSNKADVICSTRQRITACYRKEADGYKMYHMHVSNEYSELTDDEIFPFRISRQTYQYVQKLLRESAEKRNYKLKIKSGGSSGFVDISLILYIQSLERESILHMFNENRLVQNSIKMLEIDLPSHFYRLHRSYLVNCDYISKIERYKLTMITGEELPVPKKRFMQIREDITKLIVKKTDL